jgi:hypothetical protein
MEILYFSHDCKARDDSKLMKLRSKLGMQGLGIYWCIIEMLYEECGYLKISEYERITYELRTDYETIKNVINDYDLFKFKDDLFYSESALNRIKKQMEKSEKARVSVNKRWELYERNTNVIRTKNKRNTNVILNNNNNNNNNNNIKEKEKEKEKKESETLHPLQIFVSKLGNVSKIKNQLTFKECERLISEFDKKLLKEILESIENKNDAAKKYTSVNLTIRNWIRMRGTEIRVLPKNGTSEIAPAPEIIEIDKNRLKIIQEMYEH